MLFSLTTSPKTLSFTTTHFISISRCSNQSSFLNLNLSHKTMAPYPVQPSFNSHSRLPNVRFNSNHTLLLISLCTKKNSAPRWEDHCKALETVLKFYDAIKRRNLQELSNVIADECHCVSNFISSFQPFQGKKQVLELFSFLMRYMGPDIQFVVQPTLHEGMNIGVTWKLEWEKNNVPIGKGFSFYTCHSYQGKVVIRNMGMFMEPLLHVEPFRLKMMAYATSALETFGSCRFMKGNGKSIAYLLLSLVTAIVCVCLFKISIF